MALADFLLKEMIDSILKSSVAARTAVIISSDHHWRLAKKRWDGVEDFRVPFIVLLPGQKIGHKFDSVFNTVLSHSMVEKMTDGQIKNYQDIADFINRNETNMKYLK
jgi:hypothetical protein